MYIFQLYHQLSKQNSKESVDVTSTSSFSGNRKTTYIKKYERFPVLILPPPSADNPALLFDSLVKRRSGRKFGNSVGKQLLSNLLYYSAGETDSHYDDGVGRRVYSSAGARYPLEFYCIFFKQVENIQTGVYHYDIETHGLRKIQNAPVDSSMLAKEAGYTFIENASFVIVFTGSFSRVTDKYGEKAYRFILLEAGSAMQNFSLVAHSLAIDSVSVGSNIEEKLETLLDIDGVEESVVHTMFFG